jgi:hypothetical protein
MSSRQEEKERRRQERLAAEQAARRGSDSRKRAGIALGALVAVAAVVFVLVAAVSGGDEGANQTVGDVAVPAVRITDLDEAARTAGCRVRTHPEEGRQHVPPETQVRYRTNPPTSGDHTPPPAAPDGIYAPGQAPEVKGTVHSLEHGRINIQYRQGTPAERVNQLETLFSEEVQGVPGYRSLLFENQTGMSAAVAATAWGYSLTCPEFNDRVFDAIRAFREERQGKGPEIVD